MTQSRRLDDYGDVLTLADVAVILGWHLETVRLWARQGKLPARKAERQYLVLKKDLVDWLEALPRVDTPSGQTPSRES